MWARAYEVAGVTVTNMKLEQSAMREVTPGILPVRVPVTVLENLLASYPEEESTTGVMAKASMKERNFILGKWISMNLGEVFFCLKTK